jgi:hypothetical protein
MLGDRGPGGALADLAGYSLSPQEALAEFAQAEGLDDDLRKAALGMLAERDEP